MKMKVHKKYWRRVRKSLGICVKCGVRFAVHGKNRCSECRKARKSEKP